jgi:hypothetical protein
MWKHFKNIKVIRCEKEKEKQAQGPSHTKANEKREKRGKEEDGGKKILPARVLKSETKP